MMRKTFYLTTLGLSILCIFVSTLAVFEAVGSPTQGIWQGIQRY